MSLKLVEEFDGQSFEVYETEDFIKKSLPVLEAMSTQKTGKKLFLGIASNAIVGIANSMSFFWWTPTRLMSKKDLSLMTAHVVSLKAKLVKLQKSEKVNAKNVATDTDGLEEFINEQCFSTDDETEAIMAEIVEEEHNSSIIAENDDNGNQLPVPKPSQSTPKLLSSCQPSQKLIWKEIRQANVEQCRISRQGSLAESSQNLSTLMDAAEDETAEKLRLTLSFKNPGGINYIFYYCR